MTEFSPQDRADLKRLQEKKYRIQNEWLAKQHDRWLPRKKWFVIAELVLVLLCVIGFFLPHGHGFVQFLWIFFFAVIGTSVLILPFFAGAFYLDGKTAKQWLEEHPDG